MKKAKLQKAMPKESDLGRRITMELALLKFAPEPPVCEGSCRRIAAKILEEGWLEKWPEEVQSAWYDYLQKKLFD